MQIILPAKLSCVLVSSSCCENSSVVIPDLTYESHNSACKANSECWFNVYQSSFLRR